MQLSIASVLMLLAVTLTIQAIPISNVADMLPQTSQEAQLPDLEDLQVDGGSRKKRCFGNSATTTAAPYRDLDFENPPKVGDPVEPFDKTNKYFGTTPSPDNRSIKKRMSTNKYSGLLNLQPERLSTLTEYQKSFFDKITKLLTVLTENQVMLKKEDNTTKKINGNTTFGRTMRKRRSMNNLSIKSNNTNYEEEEALKMIKIKEKVGNIIRRWNIMRALTMIEHQKWNQSKKYNKENEYKIFPGTSMTPVPSPLKYFEFDKIHEVPLKIQN